MKREWSARFIDAPAIGKQRQPCITAKDVERCFKQSASDQEKLLYAVLAGSGLRIAEALAIRVSGTEEQTSWDQDGAAIFVRSSIFNGREIARLKTVAARRTVDLDSRLNDLIAQYADSWEIKSGDYLFQSRKSRALHVNTARHWLAARGIPGFHSFRRFFISRRRSIGFPEPLLRSVVGHSGKSITDVYDKSVEDEAYRKEWATTAALGFDLPELCKSGRPAPSSAFSADAIKLDNEPTPTESVATAEQVVRYEATDDDLPIELFESSTETLAEVE